MKYLTIPGVVKDIEKFCILKNLIYVGRLVQRKDFVQVGEMIKIKEKYYIISFQYLSIENATMATTCAIQPIVYDTEKYEIADSSAIVMIVWDTTSSMEYVKKIYVFHENQKKELRRLRKGESIVEVFQNRTK
ncbi:MAG: hypothetical protein HFJ27_02700 [Clostridia bacterium]|nr:hypothetical protein [Clostridia bacterium]